LAPMAILPAIKTPNAAERNHIPISCPVYCFGASLVVKLRPTGLRLNSPKVWKRYVTINQVGAASSPDAAILVAKYITKKPIPKRINPKANFKGELGSKFLLPNHIHMAPKMGANIIMNRELMDWK